MKYILMVTGSPDHDKVMTIWGPFSDQEKADQFIKKANEKFREFAENGMEMQMYNCEKIPKELNTVVPNSPEMFTGFGIKKKST